MTLVRLDARTGGLPPPCGRSIRRRCRVSPCTGSRGCVPGSRSGRRCWLRHPRPRRMWFRLAERRTDGTSGAVRGVTTGGRATRSRPGSSSMSSSRWTRTRETTVRRHRGRASLLLRYRAARRHRRAGPDRDHPSEPGVLRVATRPEPCRVATVRDARDRARCRSGGLDGEPRTHARRQRHSGDM